MRSVLGYPRTSSFGTFAYAASPHIDQDVTPTTGWVMDRSPAIARDESNFVWASHGLLVEMAHNTLWFWDSKNDHHGTTLNSLMLAKSSLTPKARRDNASLAQWTRVYTIPERVQKAYRENA